MRYPRIRLNPSRWSRLCLKPRGTVPKERTMIYECICGTTFYEYEGEHKNGYLVCPSCWSEDIREVNLNEGNDNEAQSSSYNLQAG
jgi:DNA-directed RNA polymerase subunit RPC12/RpoP